MPARFEPEARGVPGNFFDRCQRQVQGEKIGAAVGDGTVRPKNRPGAGHRKRGCFAASNPSAPAKIGCWKYNHSIHKRHIKNRPLKEAVYASYESRFFALLGETTALQQPPLFLSGLIRTRGPLQFFFLAFYLFLLVYCNYQKERIDLHV